MMIFLATRLGDIAVEDLLVSMFFVGLVMMLAVGVAYILVDKKKKEEMKSLPVEKAVAKVIDIQHPAPGELFAEARVLFEIDEGRRVRLSCNAHNDYMIGDAGYLQWQGNRFISFERGKTELDQPQVPIGEKECPRCGCKQRGDRSVCYRCGCTL